MNRYLLGAFSAWAVVGEFGDSVRAPLVAPMEAQ
jgi:hypothetical protein